MHPTARHDLLGSAFASNVTSSHHKLSYTLSFGYRSQPLVKIAQDRHDVEARSRVEGDASNALTYRVAFPKQIVRRTMRATIEYNSDIRLVLF